MIFLAEFEFELSARMVLAVCLSDYCIVRARLGLSLQRGVLITCVMNCLCWRLVYDIVQTIVIAEVCGHAPSQNMWYRKPDQMNLILNVCRFTCYCLKI